MNNKGFEFIKGGKLFGYYIELGNNTYIGDQLRNSLLL